MMNSRLSNIIIAVLLILTNIVMQAVTPGLQLVTNGTTKYNIVTAEKASVWDSLAAQELQKYIFEISKCNIPIVNDNYPVKDFEIVLGINGRSRHINLDAIQDDGFRIQTDNYKLYLIGNNHKGTLNAVYTFLEKYLGCSKYSSNVEVIPTQSTINIPNIDLLDNPAFAYRDVHYYDTFDNDYSRWHKLVTAEDKQIWGMFVHTFHELMPPEKYFEEHPEYFAFRNGIRVPEQPCLSNPKVYDIIISELERRMKENPEAQIWSVSQNDNYSFCRCENCNRIDSHEESPSGSVLNIVNRIAREFPDKTISTLAYQYSRKAPKYLKPEKNVNIMLCTIECYRTNPIATDTSNGNFLKDLNEWSGLTDNIFLWDYVVQFTNMISPFPNFQVLQPNIQLFADKNIRMMFQQGSGFRQHTEFAELRTYLIAKLLWNPHLNVDSLMNDFLKGYYGDAGVYLRSYIDSQQSALLNSNFQLSIYGDPVEAMNNYLSPELMDKYNSIFDEAETSVATQPVFLDRVKLARLPLKYAMLEQAKVTGEGKRGLVLHTDDSTRINPLIQSLLEDLADATQNAANIYLNEKGLTPEEYIGRYKRMLSKTMINPIGLNKSVEFITAPNWKYPANGEKTLTDGRRGDEDHHYNWLGFEGNSMEVIIDLDSITSVSKVSADFLQISFSWIFLPEKFIVSSSVDGVNFKQISVVKKDIPVTKEETTSPAYAFITNFECNFKTIKTRYIKVEATNMGTCPRWHPGYPFKAWIFTDEIVVK